MQRSLIVLSIVLLPAVFLAGCGGGPLTTPHDFIGFITDIEPVNTGDVIGRVLVESDADKIVSKYWITVTDNTLLYEEKGQGPVEVTFADLALRQWVRVWIDGPVAESFPMQAKAAQIIIVPRP